MSKRALYVGCDRVTCVFNDSKNAKCTRVVIMHDDKGRCKSYVDPTEGWLSQWLRGRKASKQDKQGQAKK